jgi:hypothetical protein
VERLHRGDESVGLDEDLVARAEACGEHREQQGVGSGGDPAHVAHAEEGRHLGLEAAHLLAAQEVRAGEHALARRQQLCAVRLVFAGEV